MATIVTRSGKGSPLTHAEVDANFTNLNTDKLELSGGTMTGNLSFGDNNKAIFGAGSDLQIYHDATASYVSEQGVGPLNILASQLNIYNATETSQLAQFNTTSSKLFHNNAQKFATTSTGIDVTGTVTADGLTVDGLAEISASNTRINLYETDTTDKNTQLQSSNSRLMIKTLSDDGLTATERLRVDHSTGDISFYEDTGTTAKFFWDASAESLGIGTSSPSNLLHLYKASGGNYSIVENTSGKAAFGVGSSGEVTISAESASNPIRFLTSSGGTERMRIDSSGNVGIGVSVPSMALDVAGACNTGGQTGAYVLQTLYDTTAFALGVGGGIGFAGNAGPSTSDVTFATINGIKENSTTGNYSGALTFKTRQSGAALTERMRIDSSGNLLVGMTTANTSNDGAGIRADGLIHAKRASVVATLNRKTSDGTVVEIAKDNTVVGSIGSQGGDSLTIGNGDTGLLFTGANDAIHPWNTSTNASRDGAIDLGRSSQRFKDLYLSGGVYLGGTGAANKLDDYEEGTWTPVAFGTSTSGTATYSQQKGFYVKIGRSVHYQIYIGWSGHTGTGNLRFSGLPFTAGSASNVAYSAPTVSYVNGLTFGTGQLGGYVNSNGNTVSILMNNSNTTPTAIGVDANVAEIIISGVYATA